MITLFTVAKPFRGHIETIQCNAIRSWKASCHGAEIVVYGDDYGTRRICEQLGVDHGGAVRRSEFGRFLVSDAFNRVRTTSRFDLLGYVNCDIILFDDFCRCIEALTRTGLQRFLLSARRRLLEVTESLSFSSEAERTAFRTTVLCNCALDSQSALDCFVFPRSYSFEMPAFAVGQIAWDNWMIHHAIQDGAPVIDATPDCVLVHQNHDQFSNGPFSAEAKRNLVLAGGVRNLATLRDATWLLCEGRLRRPRGLRRAYLFVVKFSLVRKLLCFKRAIKRLLFSRLWIAHSGSRICRGVAEEILGQIPR